MFNNKEQFIDLTKEHSSWLKAISTPNPALVTEIVEEGEIKLTHEMMQTLADEARARLAKFRMQCFMDNTLRGL